MSIQKLKALKDKAACICSKLHEQYPIAECELDFKNSFEVLIATILSAQCTDKKVNTVTPELFKRYPSSKELAFAKQKNVEEIIRSLGLYKNKAKNIIAAAKSIEENYAGKLPDTIEKLVLLAGVGRKTANCVLVNAFNKPGIMVDTHCKRLCNRLGLTVESSPEKIEKEVKKILSEALWSDFSHRIILHGRRVCIARNPDCKHCCLQELCDYYIRVVKVNK